GPGQIPVWGDKRDYMWYLKDGYFIRSPLAANGVTISEEERRKAEDDYLKQQKARDAARQRLAARGGGDGAAPQDAGPKDVESLIKQTREPEFISSAYFLRFKFEQGKYAFVGHEQLEGKDVLRIEYYPARLFTHEQDRQANARGGRGRGRDGRSPSEQAYDT